MQLNYGDSEYSHSWIEYDLGPMKCSGKAYFYPSEIKAASFKFKIWMKNVCISCSKFDSEHFFIIHLKQPLLRQQIKRKFVFILTVVLVIYVLDG